VLTPRLTSVFKGVVLALKYRGGMLGAARDRASSSQAAPAPQCGPPPTGQQPPGDVSRRSVNRQRILHPAWIGRASIRSFFLAAR